MWVEFIVGSCPDSESFSRYSGTSLQKPAFPNSIRNLRATGLSVKTDCGVSPMLNKVDLFIFN